MRITKAVAQKVAQQLISERQTEIENLSNELNRKAYEIYLDTVPKQVLDIFKSNSSYFKNSKKFYVQGVGLNTTGIDFDVYTPYVSQYFTLCEKDANIFVKLINNIQAKQKELNEFKIQIEVALLNLRTYNNIEKQFPEAAKLLPIQQTTAIMVNIKDIRCKLDKANC